MLAAHAPAARAGSAQCPDSAFLSFGAVVYAGEATPPSVRLIAGDELGSGEVNRPRGTDPCQREQVAVSVFAIDGADPGTAVLAEGASGDAFILGGRCSGFPEPDRWDCVLNPLEYEGRPYTAVAYPFDDDPRGELQLGDELGQATLAGGQVTVRAISGVDPAVAVGVGGRPSEAFLAPGVCPYERFAADPQQDDLATCLGGPLWFVFEPLAAGPEEEVRATGDRAAPAALAGSAVSLVRLQGVSDTLPETLGETAAVGTIALDAGGRASLTFPIPELAEGVYEAVIACEACAASYGGQAAFAAGSIVVLEGGGGGSSSAKLLYIAVFSVMFLAIIAAIALWMRGHRPRFQRRSL